MKVDRNTINNDLKILYREALTDYSPEDMSLVDILQKQLFENLDAEFVYQRLF
mgnify:CR=1 FL=1